MIGIYFSGTGNTKHCVERFVFEIDSNAKCFSIEDKGLFSELFKHDTVVFGFPIYYSNVPKIVKDFITENQSSFRNKKVFIIATKGMFNAYGIVCAAKMFRTCGAEISGSLQLIMPDNIRDLLIMELAFTKKYGKVIAKADNKIEKAAKRFKTDKPTESGLSVLNHTVGFVLKILPFYPKTDKYIKAPEIDNAKCSKCGLCTKICPMKNLILSENRIISGENCTMCYRCFNNCPQKALTVLGNKVYDQYLCENIVK
jgi:ferredoxin/flavodoxin